MGKKKEKLQILIEKLTKDILVVIEDGVANGTLKPQYEICYRWKVNKFDKNTGQKNSAVGKRITKFSWRDAVYNVLQITRSLSMYYKSVVEISEVYKLDNALCSEYLDKLIIKIIESVLSQDINSQSDITKYITLFIKDLKEEEQKYTVIVELKGILLNPRLIKLDNNVSLRKPVKSDFEKEFYSGLTYNSHIPDPTAFLYVLRHEKGDIPSFRVFNKLQKEVDRVTKILSLFRVGSIEYINYYVDTDSIINTTVSSASKTRFSGVDSYLITRDDVSNLKTFWSTVNSIILPIPLVGEQKDANEISIAYDRYCDSLESGALEKRISSAVMGLEALYLSPSEQQELSYRLRMRISKLLSLIGYTSNKVRVHIRDAYYIRSTYVHGGLVSKKDRTKYEKAYGNLNEFSKIIMDYLRASIVALLKRPSKTSLIQIIDDSFLDNKKEEEIRKLLFVPY